MNRLLAALAVIAFAVGGFTAALVLTSNGSPPTPVRAPTQPTQAPKTSSSGGLLAHVVTPSTGVTLRASNGTWTNTPTSFAYLWEDCNTGGTGCGTAAGSPTNGTTYIVVTGDVGHTIRVVVTATNSAGSASQTSLATGTVTSPTGVLLFNGNFETPVASGAASPWNSTPQCSNYGTGNTNGTQHYPGNFYFDSGGSNPASPAPTLGGNTTFNAASNATVPPLAGTYSGRIVHPTTPTGYVATLCVLNGFTTPAPGDLGTTTTYGLAFYLPPNMQLDNTAFWGALLWEFHFNAVWGAPIALALHTAGPGATNGTANSVSLSIESGACNAAGSLHPGCQYRANAGVPACTNFTDSNIGAVHCLPSEYVIPPGAVQYGTWNELVTTINWEATATGSIQTFYKPETSPTWVAGANVTGIPTVQWNVATQGPSCTVSCGYPVYEAVAAYTASLSAPFQINFDNELIGTSLASVENLMPTSSSTPTPPSNSVVPAVSGSTVQGSVLSTTQGTWTGTPTPSFSYQWQDCNSGGTSCGPASGSPSNGATYTLVTGDVGHTIRAVVTAQNTAGTASATSTATGLVTAPSAGTGTGISLAACTGACTTPSFSQSTINIAAPGSGCIGSNSVTDQCPTQIFVPGNLNVHNPAAPVPLVIDFPDGSGVSQGNGMGDWINYSPTGRYIVVEACWSTGSKACDFTSHDSEFRGPISSTPGTLEGKQVNAIINYMQAHYSVDPSRQFVVGGSKGGNAAADAACDPTVETRLAGVADYSSSYELNSSPTAAPFTSGACRAFLTAPSPPPGTLTPVSSPHPIMYQFVWSPQDTATRVDCYQETTNCASSPATSRWFMPPITTSHPGFVNEIFAAGMGCTASTTAGSPYDSVSGGAGQLSATTFTGCGTLASGGTAEAQAVQYTKSNGLTTCHWASCTQTGPGSFSYNIARASWTFWTTGTSTPS